MSGTLAITLREPDGTEHRLLGWNTIAPSFIRTGIPEGDAGAVEQVLASWTRMRADLAKNGPTGPFRYRNTDWFAPPGRLAPEEYGLLVVDLAERVILDGQEGHPLDRIPLYRVIDGFEVADGLVTYLEDSDTHRFAQMYAAGRVRTLDLPALQHRIVLEHLKPAPGARDTLRFRDREEGDVIEVEVYYSRGMGSTTRGIFLAIRPAHIDGAGVYSCILLAGRSRRVRALPRSSSRVLAEVPAAADGSVAELAATYRDDREAGNAAFDALAAALMAG